MNINEICIQGTKETAKAIIQFFQIMGGKNTTLRLAPGPYYYFINAHGYIDSSHMFNGLGGRTLIRLQPNSLLPEDWCVRTPCKSVLNWINNNLEPHEDGQREYYLDGDGWFGSLDGCRWCDNHAWAIDLTESQFLALSGYKPEQKELIDMVKEMCKKEDSDDWDRLKQAPAQKEQREEPFQWTDELVRRALNGIICEVGELKDGDWVDYINDFKAKQSRKPLFTTEDGEPVYEGDRYCEVMPDFELYVTNAVNCAQSGYKKFSTQTQAEKYIFNHKPVLSYHEVNVLFADITGGDWLNLKQLVESKLK